MSGCMSLPSCVEIHLLQSECFPCCEERGPAKKAEVYSCGFFHSPRCLHQWVFGKPGVLTLSVNGKCIRTWQWEVPSVDFQGHECVVKAAWHWSAVASSLQYVVHLCLPHALSHPYCLSYHHFALYPPLFLSWSHASSLDVLSNELFPKVPCFTEQNSISNPMSWAGWSVCLHHGESTCLPELPWCGIWLVLGWCTTCGGQPFILGASPFISDPVTGVSTVLSGASAGASWKTGRKHELPFSFLGSLGSLLDDTRACCHLPCAGFVVERRKLQRTGRVLVLMCLMWYKEEAEEGTLGTSCPFITGRCLSAPAKGISCSQVCLWPCQRNKDETRTFFKRQEASQGFLPRTGFFPS